MKRHIMIALCAALGALAVTAPAALAAFNFSGLEVKSEVEGGGDAVQAGSHPFAIVTQIGVETEIDPESGKTVPTGELKDLDVSFPQGLVGNPGAVPLCPTPIFLAGKKGECDDASAVGVAEIEFGEPGKVTLTPIYNLEPSPGTAAKLGFVVEDRAPVTIEVGLNPDSPSNVVAHSTSVSQALFFFRAKVTVWGVPASPAHDEERGTCLLEGGKCSSGLDEVAFLTLPTSCTDPFAFRFRADSWQEPGSFVEATAAVGEPGPPLALSGCDALDFEPIISAQPTTSAASSATGLDFGIDVDDPGLIEPAEEADATIRKATVTLPVGMTLNPSAANGLDSCSEADFFAETLESGPTCSPASKVGTVEVETPLLEGELLEGSLYVATPFDNPFDSLIAVYMTIRDPERGILVKLPGKVSPDPNTGQLTTTFGEPPFSVPQVPFSHFRFHFRSGPRAPLTTPSDCGPHAVTAVFDPSSGNAPFTTTATFSVTSGPDGSPCPSSSPFAPRLEAGSQISTAGAFSPFSVHLSREDGEQEITSFSSVLPPGVTGKIAGVAQCPQVSVQAAKVREGALEQAMPSCPQTALIGHLESGAGVGSTLTWVSGRLYLGGPFEGAPLSVVAVVPAVAGPFDLGTVVVQEGLDLDPYTGEVEVKGQGGQIPRFLQGVPLKLRDLRIHVDRPSFTLNPTSCEASATRATLTGSTGARSSPISRYQASGCSQLSFKPKLALSMKGATGRSGHPALTATLAPRAGDANIGSTTVLLPPSQFIDQAHINNPCTRVQFSENACPAKSILGTARALTPLLDAPLEGPVYFRSNGGERELPDIVADLRGQFRIVLVGYVDSRHQRLRTRFLTVPDAPVSNFVLKLKGGKQGLLQNSTNLCARKQLARLVFVGQNGRSLVKDQAIKASCRKNGKRRHRR